MTEEDKAKVKKKVKRAKTCRTHACDMCFAIGVEQRVQRRWRDEGLIR